MSIDLDPGTSGFDPVPSVEAAPAVSVIIPCHNAARQLERCLDFLRKNDLRNTEILVVDDASTDATGSLVEAMQGFPQMRYFRLTERSGPAAARNRGIEEAGSPYLLFLDSDILLPPQALGWIRDTLDLYSHRNDVAGVLGAYAETIPSEDFFSNYKNLGVTFLYHQTDTLSPYLHTPIFCVKKEVLESVGGFDSAVATAEDFHLGTLLGSRGHRFVIDRRLGGVHLKRYGLGTILREDWRRVHDLGGLHFTRKERRFALQAHRFHRLLALVLPGPTLAALALAPWSAAAGWAALLMAGTFTLCLQRFLRYCRAQRGVRFALGAGAFAFVEMLWAEAALASSLFSKLRARVDGE